MSLDILRAVVPYVDGYKIAGSSSLLLPKLKPKTAKLDMGGVDGESEVEFGLQALEAKIKLFTIEPRMLKLSGLAPGKFKTFNFNGGTISESNGAELGALCRITGKIADSDPGDWKPNDKTEWDYRIIVKTYRLTIGSEVIYDIDPENFIRIVNGVDQLSGLRAVMMMD